MTFTWSKGKQLTVKVQWHESASAEQNAALCCLLACVCSHTVEQIRNLILEVLSQPPYSRGLAPRDLHLFWPLKTPYVTSIQIGREVKEAVHARLAQQPTLVLPMNYCLGGTMEEVCRMWRGLHWRLMSLCCICFCYKLLYIIFRIFTEMTLVRPSTCILSSTVWNWTDIQIS